MEFEYKGHTFGTETFYGQAYLALRIKAAPLDGSVVTPCPLIGKNGKIIGGHKNVRRFMENHFAEYLTD
ncbi:MAG: hypothetical protein WC613_02025 [Candidatus Aenigmatarchaeota archaeon]